MAVVRSALPLDDATQQVAFVSEAPAVTGRVLPFANLSDDPEDTYFTDGLAAEVRSQLAAEPQFTAPNIYSRDERSRLVVTVQLSSLAEDMEAGYRQGFGGNTSNAAIGPLGLSASASSLGNANMTTNATTLGLGANNASASGFGFMGPNIGAVQSGTGVVTP